MSNLFGWLGNVAFVIGAVLLACKKKAGFLANVLGFTCYLFVGCLLRMGSLIVCEGTFICVSIWSYLKWKKEEK